jgi:AcrR family transcriptional regulator
MGVVVQIILNENLFLRDPEKSELGKKIIGKSIELINELGFESFTFKKLAVAIESTEASIYRYFENKHRLLVYLMAWYWAWLEFQIDYMTHGIEQPQEKMETMLRVISEAQRYDPHIAHINEAKLHEIVVAESSKVYLTKNVGGEAKEGLFTNYSSLCKRISEIILAVYPDYTYARSLASNLIETAHEQLFFAKNLPSLTDLRIKNNDFSPLFDFLKHIAFSALKVDNNHTSLS